jgi:hypothetical protein
LLFVSLSRKRKHKRKTSYRVSKIRYYDDKFKNKENKMPKLKNKKLITEEDLEKLTVEDEEGWR